MSNDPLTKEAISFISHELRNPLAAMQLYLEMLLRGTAGPLTDKQKDMVQELMASQQKMNQIIEEFRAKYGKPPSGDQSS
jgi:signal transduction histidine kinase